MNSTSQRRVSSGSMASGSWPGLKRRQRAAAGTRGGGRFASRRVAASLGPARGRRPVARRFRRCRRLPRFSRLAACSDPSRCGSRISRSASSGRSARARVISSKSSVAGISASSKHRPLRQQVAPRAGQDRAAGKRLAALEPHQLRQRDVDAVLAGDVLDQPAPAGQARRASRGVVAGDHAAGGAGAGDDDELGAVERREHRGERVPGILADEDRRPAPAGVERLHAPARLDEALLVEDAVGGEEDLPVDVADPGVGPAERGVRAPSCRAGFWWTS